jgi:hypothetical protein
MDTAIDTADEDIVGDGTPVMEMEIVDRRAVKPTEIFYSTSNISAAAVEETETVDTTPQIGAAAIEETETDATPQVAATEPAKIDHTEKEREVDREVDTVGTVFVEMKGKVLRRSGRQAEKTAV